VGALRSSPFVLTVGLNPAWQNTLRFERFRPGEVNRAAALLESAAGKAINAARAIRTVGGRGLVLQFAGGWTGRLLRRELRRENIRHVTVPVRARTRVCTTVLDEHTGSMTELIEPSGTITAREVRQMRETAGEYVPRAAVAALCGSWPPGVPASLPADIVRRAAGDTVVVLDAWRDAHQVLAAGVHVLKVNLAELQRLADESTPARSAETLFRRYPLSLIAVTAGGGPVCVFTRREAWRFILPDTGSVVNPLGAGDCVTGVLAWHFACSARLRQDLVARNVSGDGIVPPLRAALAAASASCASVCPAEFNPTTAGGIQKQVRVERL